MNLKYAFAAAVLATGVSLQAADQWQLKLGYSYRSLGDIDLQAAAQPASNYINGSVIEIGGGITELTANDVSQFNDPINPNQVTYASLGAVGRVTEDSESADGAMISAEFPLMQMDNGNTLNLELSFQALSAEVEATSATTFNYSGFDLGATNFVQNGDIWEASVNTVDLTPLVNPVGNGLTGSTRVGLDLDLYVLSAGVTYGADFNGWSMGFGAGATANFVSSDLTVNTTVANVGSFNDSNSEDEVLMGAYVSAYANVDLTESVFAGVVFRYDEVFENHENESVEADLTGSSSTVYVGMRF